MKKLFGIFTKINDEAFWSLTLRLSLCFSCVATIGFLVPLLDSQLDNPTFSNWAVHKGLILMAIMACVMIFIDLTLFCRFDTVLELKNGNVAVAMVYSALILMFTSIACVSYLVATQALIR